MPIEAPGILLPSDLDLPPPAASTEASLSLAHSSAASLANQSSSGNRLDALLPGEDVPEHHVTRPILGSLRFFRRACPLVLVGQAHHCRLPCGGHQCRRWQEEWAAQKMAALFATAATSTSPLLLSGVRLLLRGPGARETVRRSAGCKPAPGRSPRPTSSPYSSVNPRSGPDQPPEGRA